MDVELTAQLRAENGKGPARRLRSEGFTPAIVYGPKTTPVSVSVPVRRLEKLLKDAGGEARLIRLTVEGEETTEPRFVLIRDVQVHPIRRKFLHVDFYQVDMEQKLVAEVPVELMGEPIGLKFGGMLNLLRRTLAVHCLPADIPEKVRIDVAPMQVGDIIHVSDLIDKVDFELADDPSFPVVSVSGPDSGKASKATDEAAGE